MSISNLKQTVSGTVLNLEWKTQAFCLRRHEGGLKLVKTVKITTENRISVVELPSWSLKNREKELHADCIETVKTQRMYELFGDMVVMLVDESGLIQNKPLNACASWLYGADQHGSFIVGDVLLGMQRGSDILPPDYPERLLRLKFPMIQKG